MQKEHNVGQNIGVTTRKRFQISVYAGLTLGVIFGLLNAYFIWQPFDRQTLLAKKLSLPVEFQAPSALWSETPIFLTSVLAYAAIGGLFGALLGWFRKRSKKPAPDTRREFVRDVFALLFGVFVLLAAGFGPGYIRRAENPAQGAITTVIGLALCYGLFRALTWLLGRMLRSRPASFMLEHLPWKALGIAAAAGFVLFSLAPPLFSPPSQPPPAPTGKAAGNAPNVLMIVLDTARADRFSAYGYENPTTPEIDRIAAEGTLFEQAVSSAVYTLPGHASLFTGAPSSVHGANTPLLYLDSSMTTLAEILSRNGYRTAGFSNNRWVGTTSSLTQGFLHYEDHWRFDGFKPLHFLLKICRQMQAYWQRDSEAGGAAYTLPRVLDWIESVRSTGERDGNPAPFFVFINLMEPHYPVSYKPGFTDGFMDPEDTVRDLLRTNQDFFRVIRDPSAMSPEDYRRYGVLYDGELRYADHHLGMFLRELERRGLLDNTLLIITSDHGEAIGDHGLMGHRQSVYGELTRVPLILRHPRIQPAGHRVPEPVQTFDIFRTVLDFAGVEEPLPPDAALSRNLLEDPRQDRRIVAEEESAEWAVQLSPKLSEQIDPSLVRKRYKAIYDGNLKYIWGTEGVSELYDLARDPRETRNLAPERPEEVERLSRELIQWEEQLPANRIEGARHHEPKIDRETEEKLRSLGYIQ